MSVGMQAGSAARLLGLSVLLAAGVEGFLSPVSFFPGNVACARAKGCLSARATSARAPRLALRQGRSRQDACFPLRMGESEEDQPPAGSGEVGGADGEAVLTPEERANIWEEADVLKDQMDLAVEGEQYTEAAELRDRIQAIKMRDPYTRAEAALAKAVAAEEYEEAARLRREMQAAGKPPLRRKKEVDMGQLARAMGVATPAEGAEQKEKSYSDTVTSGIRVQVDSFYLPGPSAPSDGRLMFGYNITITNLNLQTCQLVSRTWQIKTVFSDKKELVSGSGVIGRQPVLGQNESFSYSSVCPLTIDRAWLLESMPVSRLVGSMEGSYLMVSGATGQESFQALIDPFHFTLPPEVEIEEVEE